MRTFVMFDGLICLMGDLIAGIIQRPTKYGTGVPTCTTSYCSTSLYITGAVRVVVRSRPVLLAS